jgi:cytochrome bd-type quinol oxidase subunit 2
MRASFFCGKLLPLDRCRGDTYFLPPVRNGAGADTKHVMTRLTRIELFALIGAGAVGAGVHAAIAPEHLHEWAPLGASFVAVAVLLAAAVAAVVIRRADRRPVAALSVLLAAVATGYLVTRLVAVPPLDPERESFDALGICTSAVEVFGVVLAVHITLIRR